MRRPRWPLITILTIAALALTLTLLKQEADPRAFDPLPVTGNGPIDVAGGDRGVLLLHGLTATPWELRTLAASLAANNLTVVAPVLAGHGTTAADLDKTRWQDWYASADASLGLLQKRTKSIYVVGVSTGADLAILLAARNRVDGIVLIAPPITLRDKRSLFAGWYGALIPYTDHAQTGADVGHYYEVTPSNAIAELNGMIDAVKEEMPKVEEPALILQSLHDKTVDPSSATYVFDNLGSADKEWKLYGNASHVLLQDKDAETVIFPSIADFIRRH
jgi:carboxylesterase